MQNIHKIILVTAMLSLSACSSMSKTDRAVVGGLVGAGAGAAVNTSAGAVLGGAAIGAVVGALSY